PAATAAIGNALRNHGPRNRISLHRPAAAILLNGAIRRYRAHHGIAALLIHGFDDLSHADPPAFAFAGFIDRPLDHPAALAGRGFPDRPADRVTAVTVAGLIDRATNGIALFAFGAFPHGTAHLHLAFAHFLFRHVAVAGNGTVFIDGVV